MNRLFRILLLFSTTLSIALSAGGQSVEQAATSADADLRDALKRLTETRRQIEAEKLPLARRLQELEQRVEQKRREAARLQQARDTGALSLENLKADTRARADELQFVDNLLGEYVRGFESRIDVAEIALYENTLSTVKAAIAKADRAERIRAELSLLDDSIARLRRHVGGRSFGGEAIGPDGVLISGRFALSGPMGWFASESGVSGISIQSDSLLPRVIPVSEEAAGPVRSLVFDGQASAPVDVTLGNATALAEADQDLITHLKKGRVWMIPILAFALLAVLITLFKFFDIFLIPQPQQQVLRDLLERIRQDDSEGARKEAENLRGPFGRMLQDAVQHAGERKELLDEILYEHILATQPRVERLLPFLSVTAATAPLLGLLGTVTGMIHTFTLINVFGVGNPRSMASGISEALVTTEAGLVVAIFALIAHALLSRRAQGLLANMEAMAVAFVNGLPGRRQSEEQDR